MSDVLRVDFSKGIYGELEGSIIPESYAALVCNALMESGTPRPVKGPVVAAAQTVWTGANTQATQAPPGGTTQIYTFRNIFYYSGGNRRFYASERYGLQDRVYYADGAQPMKIINGQADKLGIVPPIVPLVVTISDPLIIKAPRLTAIKGAGKLQPGTYAYRIGPEFSTGQTADGGFTTTGIFSPVATVIVSDPNSGVKVEWDSSVDAFAGRVQIYGRLSADVVNPVSTLDGNPWTSLGSQGAYNLGGWSGMNLPAVQNGANGNWSSVVAPLFSSQQGTSSWVDDGTTATPAKNTVYGSFTVMEDGPNSPGTFTSYLYTWVRSVNGHIDESGPSTPVNITGYGQRTLTRPGFNGQMVRDGLIVSGATNTITVTASTRGTRVIGIYDGGDPDYTIITVDTASGGHGLTDSQVVGMIYQVLPDSAQPKAFQAVRDMAITTGPNLTLGSAPTAVMTPATLYWQARSWGGVGLATYAVAPIYGDPFCGTAVAGAAPVDGPAMGPALACTASGTAGAGLYTSKISWPVVANATGYAIFYQDNGAGTASNSGTWLRVGIVKASGQASGLETWTDTGGACPQISGALNTVNQPPHTHCFKVKKGLISASQVVAPSLVLGYPSTMVAYLVTDQHFTMTISGGLGSYTGLAIGSTVDFSNPYLGATTTGTGITWSATSNLVTPLSNTGYQANSDLSNTAVNPFNLPSGLCVVSNIVGNVVTLTGVAPETGVNDAASSAINPIQVPYGHVDTGNITSWVVYKSQDGTAYLRAATLPLSQTVWKDDTSTVTLTDPPDSFYTENGVGVLFDAAPADLTQLTRHNGMLFGISKGMIRWTPVNRPDAWPRMFFLQTDAEPVGLLSTTDSLLVFTLSGVKRIIGDVPTDLSMRNTQATHGCIAPETIQQTHNGVVYLSQDGLVVFNNYDNRSYKLVSTKLLKRFFFSPSVPTTVFPHWWVPTPKTFGYTYLLRNFVEPKRTGMAAQVDTIVSVTAALPYIRSWFHEGKYYLYYYGNSSYVHHTILCVDMRAEDPIVTYINAHPMDVRVSEYGVCYMLFHGLRLAGVLSDGSSTLATAVGLEGAQPDDDTGFAGYTKDEANPALFTWHPQVGSTVNLCVHTGPITLRQPAARKKWRKVEVHGTGSATIWAYADGYNLTPSVPGAVTATETPSRARQMNFPRWSKGYALRLLLSGPINLVALELDADPEPRES